MSKIFELYGYRRDAWNAEADRNLRQAWCPFMGAECDGGGNRQMSAVTLSEHPALRKYFPGKVKVQAGVCSLLLNAERQPWIVCPRRLLSLRSGSGAGHQVGVRKALAKHSRLPVGEYRVWSEAKMKVGTTTEQDEAKSFDYTFDYVIAGRQRRRVADVCKATGMSERDCARAASGNGYTLAVRDGERWIDDHPADPVVIVEIMTSSTSGGNKSDRTQVAMAFEDAILNGEHRAPGINYRQVWARMVSQLIVKSQVALAWGGKAIWVIQDVLADYITASTALNLSKYLGQHPDEVNILAFGYGTLRSEPITELRDSKFYAGPITTATEKGGFVEIIKIGAPPPKSHLWRTLLAKAPVSSFRVS